MGAPKALRAVGCEFEVGRDEVSEENKAKLRTKHLSRKNRQNGTQTVVLAHEIAAVRPDHQPNSLKLPALAPVTCVRAHCYRAAAYVTRGGL